MTPIFGNSHEDSDRFRRLLDEQYAWPAAFVFKFIVPVQRLDELRLLLDGHELKTRSSSKGNYVSITLSPLVDSSEAVIQLYARVSVIEGLVAL